MIYCGPLGFYIHKFGTKILRKIIRRAYALWHNFNGGRTLLFFPSNSGLTEFNSCYKVLNMTGKQGRQVEQFAPSILDSPSLPHLTFC